MEYKTLIKKLLKKNLYNDSFYKSQFEGSYRSARHYAKDLHELYSPKSVIDFGCGRGAWLKAFFEHGSTRLVGLDGDWNTKSNLCHNAIEFHATNLNSPSLNSNERFDLAMSLEVAEHVEPHSSRSFVKALTKSSDVILFGAAITGQGGTGHINEQKHSFWAKLFMEENFVVFDLFREKMWENREIEWWYQQNTFLYVNSASPLINVLASQNTRPMLNIEFMNALHIRRHLKEYIAKER